MSACETPAERRARHFSELCDYARRKGMPLHEVERWLGPNLGYEAEGAD